MEMETCSLCKGLDIKREKNIILCDQCKKNSPSENCDTCQTQIVDDLACLMCKGKKIVKKSVNDQFQIIGLAFSAKFYN